MRYPPPYPSLGQYRPYSADNHIIPPMAPSKGAHHTWKRMLRVQQIRARMDTIKNQARLYCFADAQHRLEIAR